MHFGMYLTKKGVISAEQFVAALETQMKTLVPIGQLALEEGILSARNIFEVLQAQNDAPHERFGELAIEMGFMTRKDVMRLLMIQADRKRPFAEILEKQGVLSRPKIAGELAAYRRSLLRPKRTTTTMIVPAPRGVSATRATMEVTSAV
jgi:hypothetical protein